MAAVKLTKYGLKLREINECITSIMNYPSYTGDVTKAVEAVIKNTSSRKRYQGSGLADARFSATDKLAQEGYVTPPKAGPKGPEQMLPTVFKEDDLRKNFCSKRRSLISTLKNENRISEDYEVKDGDSLFHQNITMTVIDVCNMIDTVSDQYMAEIMLEKSKGGTITGFKRDRENLEPVTKSCNETVQALLQYDIATSYDLMKEEEYSSWKDQVCEIASFGKLMTVLEICHIEKGGTYYVKD